MLFRSRENEFNRNYFGLGLNRKGTNINDYLGKRAFQTYQIKAGALLKKATFYNSLQTDIITKDKFYCGSILAANNIATLKTLLLISRFRTISLSDQKVMKVTDLSDGDYFFKNVTIESGEGVIGFSVNSGIIRIGMQSFEQFRFKQILKKGIWIVQRHYYSHSAIQAVNSSALNTTRIFTTQGVNGVEYLGGFQAFATDGASVDSWHFSSIYVGINPEEGVLKPIGMTSLSDKRPGILLEHPNSKIRFEGYRIPFMKESVELCITAHKLFYGVFTIGWDIAITEQGPMVVEANERPGINVLQWLDGGISNIIRVKHEELKTMFNEQ